MYIHLIFDFQYPPDISWPCMSTLLHSYILFFDFRFPHTYIHTQEDLLLVTCCDIPPLL